MISQAHLLVPAMLFPHRQGLSPVRPGRFGPAARYSWDESVVGMGVASCKRRGCWDVVVVKTKETKLSIWLWVNLNQPKQGQVNIPLLLWSFRGCSQGVQGFDPQAHHQGGCHWHKKTCTDTCVYPSLLWSRFGFYLQSQPAIWRSSLFDSRESSV